MLFPCINLKKSKSPSFLHNILYIPLFWTPTLRLVLFLSLYTRLFRNSLCLISNISQILDLLSVCSLLLSLAKTWNSPKGTTASSVVSWVVCFLPHTPSISLLFSDYSPLLLPKTLSHWISSHQPTLLAAVLKWPAHLFP